MKVDDDSFTTLKANPISLVGVLQYSGKAIDPNGKKYKLKQDQFFGVFTPPWELFDPEAIDSFNGVPFREGHEMMGKGTKLKNAEGQGGSIYNVRASKDMDGVLIADMKITSAELLKKIKNGKTNLSLGYRCRYVKQSGEYKGVKYDFVKTHLRGNHIALVEHGRCGSGVRVYDSAEDGTDVGDSITFDSLEEIAKMAKEQKTPTMQDCIDKMAEMFSGASDEFAADAIEFTRDWITKHKKTPDGQDCTDAEEMLPKVEKPNVEKPQGTDTGDGEENGEGCEDPNTNDTATGDAEELKEKIVKDLAAGRDLAEKCMKHEKVGTFDCSEMGEAAVAKHVCDKFDVTFDSDEGAIAFAKGIAATAGQKPNVVVETGDSAEAAQRKAARSEAVRTSACEADYLGK